MTRSNRDDELERIVRQFLGTADDSMSPEESRRVAQESDWLRKLHDAKLEQHLADLSRLWNTAAIFVPLALAPFAVVLYEALTVAQAAVIGIASTALMVSWHLLTLRLTWHADRNLGWVRAIRREVGIAASSRPQPPTPMRELRRAMTIGVGIAWLLVLLGVQVDVF